MPSITPRRPRGRSGGGRAARARPPAAIQHRRTPRGTRVDLHDPVEQPHRRLVDGLLVLDGKAVALHEAAATVKSSQQFRGELGELSDPERRPYLARLDATASEDGAGGVLSHSYGMVV